MKAKYLILENDEKYENIEIPDDVLKSILPKPVADVDWKPEQGERYWYVGHSGYVDYVPWDDYNFDNTQYHLGNIYPTKEAAEHAIEVQKATMRIKRAATLKNPDWDDDSQAKYAAHYDHNGNALDTWSVTYITSGEIAFYATREDAEKAIKEQEADYKLVFGVE